ncbi:MAG: hypothetical protein P1U82_00585 [Verrucomicrobiales bacterium]|nr:hypothetical protein [Verrucomicrobiales bacterium]
MIQTPVTLACRRRQQEYRSWSRPFHQPSEPRSNFPPPVAAAVLTVPLFADDTFPSWNDTALKKAIIEFVEKVTQASSDDFVPISERIATFDNDGCLWAEQPMYFQPIFIVDTSKELAPQHPERKNEEPFASVLKGDIKQARAAGEITLPITNNNTTLTS